MSVGEVNGCLRGVSEEFQWVSGDGKVRERVYGIRSGSSSNGLHARTTYNPSRMLRSL